MRDEGDTQVIRHVLAAYDLGELHRFRRHGGTAAGNWKVETACGTWLVRTRGARTSSDEALAFDHGLRRHLVQHGIPSAAPVTARDGCTFTRLGGKTYELYPFIGGRQLERASAEMVASAARALAQFHQVAARYPRARHAPSLAQYATIGLNRSSNRMEDPELLAAIYDRLSSPEFEEAQGLCRRWLERLCTQFDRQTYEALPKTLTHGDYTLANLLFDDAEQVVGIFDLDWARWAPRVRDLADGMYFIGAVRKTPLRPDDIWSLTEAAQFDLPRCVTWLNACQETAPLLDAEMAMIPLAFAARWLSVRVEGMAKVAPKERLRFCFREIAGPLEWLERNWQQVCLAVKR